jgi:hypothetical protein
MTTLQQVTEALASMTDEELAQQWLHNDLIKMRIATHYDAWMDDIDDHKLPLTLIEYIETCIDEPRKLGLY